MKQYIVDAFTNTPFAGNPAAVCVMDSWPSEESMMKLAMENNLSERGTGLSLTLVYTRFRGRTMWTCNPCIFICNTKLHRKGFRPSRIQHPKRKTYSKEK